VNARRSGAVDAGSPASATISHVSFRGDGGDSGDVSLSDVRTDGGEPVAASDGRRTIGR
jgi:hypothetical protein